MLRVRTYLHNSAVHGIGLFVGEDIPKGTVVWEFNPHVDLVYTPEQWQTLSAGIAPQSLEALKRYSYKENGNYYLCLDNAQFMNHSANQFNVENDRKTNIMRACCDIWKDEELLCDYFQYGDCDDEHVLLLKSILAPGQKS